MITHLPAVMVADDCWWWKNFWAVKSKNIEGKFFVLCSKPPVGLPISIPIQISILLFSPCMHTPHPPPHFPLFFMRYYFLILLLHLIFIAATKSHNHVGALPVVRWCRKSFEKSGEQLVSSNLTDVWQPCALLSRTCKLFLNLTEKTSLLTNKVAFTIPMALHVILLWTQLPSKQQFWCEYVHISNSLGFQDIPVVCQCFFIFTKHAKWIFFMQFFLTHQNSK